MEIAHDLLLPRRGLSGNLDEVRVVHPVDGQVLVADGIVLLELELAGNSRNDDLLAITASPIVAQAHSSTGRMIRRVETPADNSGTSSLQRCIQVTVNTAASRMIASHSRSKICAT